MARKHVSQVTLTNGEKIIVSLERGTAARRAMTGAAEGSSGVWVIPEQNNRMVKATMIGDVTDTYVEDVQLQLGEQLERARRLESSGQKVEPSSTSPGYIKFLLAERRIKRKYGARLRELTEDQRIIIEEIEEREAYNAEQELKTD